MFEQLPSECAANIDPQSGSFLLLLLNTLLASQCQLKNPNLYPPDKAAEIKDGEHFDFIVVGAGSSGSVVASRLVEAGKVLILEAGDVPSVTSEIPSLFFAIQLSDQIWRYETEPAKQSCLGYRDERCRWPRGKMLGGCSSINAMLYIRGNKKDYDSWAARGNEGWDYENVMKYFKKSERLEDEDLVPLNSYGKDGLLRISRRRYNETLKDVILESAEELGYKILKQEGGIGFFETVQTIYDGVRSNAAKYFLGSVKESENIKLAMNAHVKKLIIDNKDSKAQGVEIKIGHKSLKVFADKEVILSAGALNSPQILMLSGIGPERHLEEKGIEVVHNLPVGENLLDHLTVIIFSKVSEEALKPIVTEDEIYKYFAHRKGEFSMTGVTNIQGFVNTKNDSVYPDIQYTYIVVRKNDTAAIEMMRETFGIPDESVEILKKHIAETHMLLSVTILLQPKSKGRVYLKNNDPFEHPIMRSGYLTEDEDLETLMKGINISRAQLKTEAFRKLNAEVLDIGLPHCREFKFDSDDYWRCFIKNLGTTLYHPTTTCKMGPKEDKSTVVDSRLRVHGVKNLRVVDASIMPNIISGNTNAPCMMIGQKGADMIIEDFKLAHQEL